MNTDPKSRLSQLVQKRKIGFPEYQLVERAGPPHNFKFLCSVEVNGKVYIGENLKSTLKKSQQEAARVCLETLFAIAEVGSSGEVGSEINDVIDVNDDLIQFLLGTKSRYNYVYYIDIENVSHLTTYDIQQIEKFPTTHEVIVVSSILANSKLKKLSDIVTPSSRENAADIDIIMRITKDIYDSSVNDDIDETNLMYVIVSRDKIFYTFMELQNEKVEILSL